MSELNELYQQMILDHNKRPRNFGKIGDPDRSAEGFNPLCGDHIHIYLTLDGDRISNIAFEGTGCAISKASTSIMTEAVKGKTTAEIDALFENVHQMLTGNYKGDVEDLGKLAVFSGVSQFPVRVKCATLAWHTLKAALAAKTEAVSTE